MDRDPDRNVVGGELQPCSADPLTGFFRDGCCSTGPEDLGSHTVCAVMTEAFLASSAQAGNDLSTPRPEWGFPGLQPGDRWCVCASRWLDAYQAGIVAPWRSAPRMNAPSRRCLSRRCQRTRQRSSRRAAFAVKSDARNADASTMAAHQTDLDLRATIETARLRLEPWNDSHFERFAEFMRDPAVIRYIRPEPLHLDRALEQHEHSLIEWDTHGFGKRAIIETATGQWLGFIELSLVGPRKGSRDDDVEIGYFVEPARWGEGIATEAAFAVRDEAFDRCGIEELIGRCRVENRASSRVLAKVGFRRLRLFEIDDGIVVEIHRLQRVHWTGPVRRREPTAGDATPGTGAEYRETG